MKTKTIYAAIEVPEDFIDSNIYDISIPTSQGYAHFRILPEPQPVAWIYRYPDGELEPGKIIPDVDIEDVRKQSGAWAPLYASPTESRPQGDAQIKQTLDEAKEIISDGDANGIKAQFPTSIKVRNILEKLVQLIECETAATTAAHGVPDDILNWIQQDPSERGIDSSTTWNVGYRTAWATIGIMFEKHGLLNAAPSARQESDQ